MIKQLRRALTRQIANKIAYVIIGIFMAIIPVFFSNLAGAVSPEDSNYRTREKLEIGLQGYGGRSCDLTDISSDWYSRALDARGVSGGEAWKIDLQDAIENNGRWIVTQNIEYFQNNPAYAYTITFTKDNSLSLTFSDENVIATGNGVHSILLRTAAHHEGTSDCESLVSLASFDTYSVVSNAEQFGSSRNQSLVHYLYIDEQNVTYPPDYEGIPITNTPLQPDPPLSGQEYSPDWTILTANNWKAEIRDKRFFTFDGIFWTCSEDGNSLLNTEDGLAPVINWALYDSSDNKIDEGVLSATAAWNYQFPEQNVDRTYTIKGRYDCGGSVEFGTKGEKEFTITSTGLLKDQDFFAQCITTDPPFVNFPDCIDNVFRVIEILSFNNITLVKGLNSTENCRQLQVLGNWINQPYHNVCPQFSQTVRNTVTPFVTFILGLLTSMIIVRIVNSRSIS